MVQWLRLCASTAGDTGSIPGQGTKTLPAVWCSQKKEEYRGDFVWGLRHEVSVSGDNSMLAELPVESF